VSHVRDVVHVVDGRREEVRARRAHRPRSSALR
jgi:hypothetical protein